MKLSRQFRDKEYWEFDVITTSSPQTIGLGLGVELTNMRSSSKHRVDWGDGSDPNPIDASFISHEYTTAGTYTVKVWTREIFTNINQLFCFPGGYDITNLDFSDFKYMRFFRFPQNGTLSLTMPTEYLGTGNFQWNSTGNTLTNSSNILDISFYDKITGIFNFAGTSNIDRIKTPIRPSSIEFNGTTQYVNLGDDDSFSFGNGTTDFPFTISSWVNMTDATNFPILCRYSTGTEEWAFTTDATDKIRLVLYDDSAGTNVNIGRLWNTPVTSYEGQWAHVAMTYDGTGIGGIKIYWDGVRVDDTNLSNGSYVAMENTNADTNIARFTGFSTEHADGFITNVSVFDSELSQSDIESIYNLGKNGNLASSGPVDSSTNDYVVDDYVDDYFESSAPSGFSPISWWKLNMTDDRYLPTITDSGSSGIDGTMIPTVIKSVTMDFPQNAQFYWLGQSLDSIGPNADDLLNFEWDLSGYQMGGNQCLLEGDGTNPTNIFFTKTSFSSTGPTSLFRVNNTGVTSLDLSELKMSSSSGITISLYDNINLTSITWPTASIIGTMDQFSAYNCNSYAGSWDFTWIGIENDCNFNMRDSIATSIVFPSSTATIGYIYQYPNTLPASSGQCTSINLTSVPNATEQDNFELRMENNGMTAAQVNKILVDLDTNATNAFTGRSINLSGTNAAPDTTSGGLNGSAAKTSLLGKGFTVTTS